MRITPLVLALVLAGPAFADVTVTYRDLAPKDIFTLTNGSDCATGPLDITIDLSKAVGGVVFDVEVGGPGASMSQPFELVTGAGIVTAVGEVEDGGQVLQMSLSQLEAGDEVAFTIDLDDASGARTRVSGDEIAGAVVLVSTELALGEGAFDQTGAARVILASCLS